MNMPTGEPPRRRAISMRELIHTQRGQLQPPTSWWPLDETLSTNQSYALVGTPKLAFPAMWFGGLGAVVLARPVVPGFQCAFLSSYFVEKEQFGLLGIDDRPGQLMLQQVGGSLEEGDRLRERVEWSLNGATKWDDFVEVAHCWAVFNLTYWCGLRTPEQAIAVVAMGQDAYGGPWKPRRVPRGTCP